MTLLDGFLLLFAVCVLLWIGEQVVKFARWLVRRNKREITTYVGFDLAGGVTEAVFLGEIRCPMCSDNPRVQSCEACGGRGVLVDMSPVIETRAK